MIGSRSKGCTFPLSTNSYCGQRSVKYSNSEGSLTQTTLVFNFLKVSFNLLTFFIGAITISICPSSSVTHQKRQNNSSLKTLTPSELKENMRWKKQKLEVRRLWITINLRHNSVHSEVRSRLSNLNFQMEMETLSTTRKTWITKSFHWKTPLVVVYMTSYFTHGKMFSDFLKVTGLVSGGKGTQRQVIWFLY